jgi:tetratricopeptide (TPR) repeat protein
MAFIWLVSGTWCLCGLYPWFVARSKGRARKGTLLMGLMFGPFAFAFLSNEPVITQESQLLFMRALTEQSREEYREAISDLQRAVALCPWHRFAHYALARCYAHLEMNETASRHLAAAVKNGLSNNLIDADPELDFARLAPDYSQF